MDYLAIFKTLNEIFERNLIFIDKLEYNSLAFYYLKYSFPKLSMPISITTKTEYLFDQDVYFQNMDKEDLAFLKEHLNPHNITYMLSSYLDYRKYYHKKRKTIAEIHVNKRQQLFLKLKQKNIIYKSHIGFWKDRNQLLRNIIYDTMFSKNEKLDALLFQVKVKDFEYRSHIFKLCTNLCYTDKETVYYELYRR